eukprot:m.122501 g.122501  ORF g.122501 m.122501 type:complete len:119 (-) comp17277_c0_seq5:510-866(-)
MTLGISTPLHETMYETEPQYKHRMPPCVHDTVPLKAPHKTPAAGTDPLLEECMVLPHWMSRPESAVYQPIRIGQRTYRTCILGIRTANIIQWLHAAAPSSKKKRFLISGSLRCPRLNG